MIVVILWSIAFFLQGFTFLWPIIELMFSNRKVADVVRIIISGISVIIETVVVIQIAISSTLVMKDILVATSLAILIFNFGICIDSGICLSEGLIKKQEQLKGC